jgi:hypothetical protein
MKKQVYICILIIILIIAWLNGSKIKEGIQNKESLPMDYNGTDVMMPGQIKNVEGIPETDRMMMLADIFKITNDHEILFSIYDEDYKKQEIVQNPNYSIDKNIDKIITVLKKHDNELVKLTGGKYIPTKTVDNLKNNSLTNPLKEKLMKIYNYRNKSIMPKKITDPKEMLEKSRTYEKMAKNEPDKDVKEDLIDEAKEWKFKYYKKINEDDPPDDTNTPVDQGRRITKKQINERLQFVRLFHISKILEYQIKGIKIIYTMAEEYITKRI